MIKRFRNRKISIVKLDVFAHEGDFDAALGVADIQISLEGPPDIHDAIRGAGSFNAAAKGVRLLTGAGIEVNANMTKIIRIYQLYIELSFII